jgi:hypothetical protein
VWMWTLNRKGELRLQLSWGAATAGSRCQASAALASSPKGWWEARGSVTSPARTWLAGQLWRQTAGKVRKQDYSLKQHAKQHAQH